MASQGVSPETKQRRERGRAAQAAFRKRQIDTIQSQQEHLFSFSDAFKAVSQACIKLKLAVKMCAALGNGDVPGQIATEILGQIEQAIAQMPSLVLPETKNATRISDGIDLPASKSRTALPEQSQALTKCLNCQNLQSAVEHQGSAIRSHETQEPKDDASSFPNMSSAEDTAQDEYGEFSDLLINSNCVPKSIVVHVTPIDVVPYMTYAQHAQHTFAGRLFWSTLSIGYHLAGQKNPTADRMFRFYSPKFTRDYIRKRIGIRLITNSTGSIPIDPLPEIASRMTKVVSQTLSAEGEHLHNYLDPREVELYLRRRYIDPDNLDLVTTTGCMPNEPLADRLVTSLIHQISLRAICFGDAPRYHVDDVERIYQTVIGGPMTHSQAVQLPMANLANDVNID